VLQCVAICYSVLHCVAVFALFQHGKTIHHFSSLSASLCVAACWQRVGSVLAACWQRVGSVLAACWQRVGSMLEACCSVWQFAAVCCSVLQCVAVCCSVLQCAAVSCSELQ